MRNHRGLPRGVLEFAEVFWPDMPFVHKVEQGESIDSLAFQYGLFAVTIWSDPANAGLRQKRKYRNVLLPGDLVSIPEKRTDPKDCLTDRRHVFRRRGVPAKYRLQVLYQCLPVQNAAYVLAIGQMKWAGQTDQDGFLELHIPPDSVRGVLRVQLPDPDPPLVTRLLFGHLNPIDSLSGLEQRLNNLGYLRPVPGQPAATSVWYGLRRLQRDCGLPVTGRLDEKTRGALEQLQDTGKVIPRSQDQ